MSYIKSTLMSDEKLTYLTKPHWMVFYPVILWVMISIFALLVAKLHEQLFLFGTSFYGLISLVSFVVTMYYAISALITYYASEYGITNKRVLMKTGFIRRDSLEVLLDRVESIYVEQSTLGRIFNYGTVVIAGTGGSKDPFYFIPAPLEFRRKVQEQVDLNKMK
jgi:uncharacterized membrane protein YdbT with pleckstrin-like domain